MAYRRYHRGAWAGSRYTAVKITLKYTGKCKLCGAEQVAGRRAVYHGRGRGITCLACYDSKAKTAEQKFYETHEGGMYESPGMTLSRYDKYGVYTPDGKKIGSTCGCIDYPCCGH